MQLFSADAAIFSKNSKKNFFANENIFFSELPIFRSCPYGQKFDFYILEIGLRHPLLYLLCGYCTDTTTIITFIIFEKDLIMYATKS